MPQIETDYIKTGKVKYVVRQLPLESIHRQAFKAAEAALCAGDQGKYFELHDRLFANQKALTPQDLPGHAKAIGLDVPAFEQCLESGKHASRVRKDQTDAQSAGMRGTPGFILGLTDPKDSKIKAVRTISGAQPYTVFKDAIESLLSGQ